MIGAVNTDTSLVPRTERTAAAVASSSAAGWRKNRTTVRRFCSAFATLGGTPSTAGAAFFLAAFGLAGVVAAFGLAGAVVSGSVAVAAPGAG